MGYVKTLPDFKLMFDGYYRDTKRYEQELAARGINGFLVAGREVHRAYAEKGLWAELASVYSFNDYESTSVLEITEGLMAAREYSAVKRFWRSYLAYLRNSYWYNYSFIENQTLPWDASIAPRDYEERNAKWLNHEWPSVRKGVIGAFRAYRDLVIRMNDPAELARVEGELKAIETGQRCKPKKKKPDATKIDESLFWEIIETARQSGDGSNEATVEAIANRLEDYKATEIKRFQTILLDKLDALNTWDVWALIYIAQGGCSDDSFLNFRCWVILQGKALVERCLTNIEDAMQSVPSDSSASNESLLSAADIAYDIRSGGKSMTLANRKEKGPAGVEWDEANVEAAYPAIAAYYKEQRNR